MKKSLIAIIFILLSSMNAFGLITEETLGGISTSLGSIVLDKDLGGMNALNNPTIMALNNKKNSQLNITATGAAQPYGISGIDNAAIGAEFFLPGQAFQMGFGLGFQTGLVNAGVNQYRLLVSAGFAYTGIQQSVSWISGIGIGVSGKYISYSLAQDIPGVNSTSSAMDVDVDATVSLLQKKLQIGVLANDLLASSISFLNSSTVVGDRGLYIHTRISILDNLDFFGAYNIIGPKHVVDRANFFSASTALMNQYYGLEANFGNALYIRFGVGDGNLTGGIGLIVDNLSVNIGVMPLGPLSLYYQVDLNYKLNLAPAPKTALDKSQDKLSLSTHTGAESDGGI